jgi:hypothetical protein
MKITFVLRARNILTSFLLTYYYYYYYYYYLCEIEWYDRQSGSCLIHLASDIS